MDISQTLDVKGVLCPVPVIKARQSITRVEVGGILEILATDPSTREDIPAWIKRSGHEIVTMKEEDEILKFYVRRRK
ncbi:MAG: sulfurtransferase TusA family protein [Nitrososphaerales archaeon]